MRNALAALPASLSGWSVDQIDGAIAQRRDILQAVFDEAGPSYDMGKVTVLDGDATAKAVQIRTLNDEIERLNTTPVGLRDVDGKPVGIHPTRRGVSRPGASDRRKFSSIGEAIISGLGGSSDNLDVAFQAAFDGTSGGTAAPPWFRQGLLEMPQRRVYLRDLIPTVPVTSDKVDFTKQSVNTHAAAAVAAGAQKPKSTYTIKRETATIAVIAHMSEAIDRSLLADFDSAVRFLDYVMVAGVLDEEEDQILNGSGVSPNLTGILNTVGIQTQARGVLPHFDTVLKGMTKIRNSNFEPTAIVLNPNDWEEIRLTRTADGEYIQGAPFEPGAEQLFGKQVLTTTAIAEGTGLVGAFDLGATVYDREQARVSFTETGLGDTAGQELFDRNQVRFRGESRIGLGVAFPLAFCTLTGI